MLWWLAAASIVALVATAIGVATMVIRIPPDYFSARRQRRPRPRGSVRHLVMAIGRNVVGAFFIVIGIAMLVLPGQGVITILAGLGLTDFPGKHRLITLIVGRSAVRKSLDWIRERAGRPPLVLDH
jgi:hypothetical protein